MNSNNNPTTGSSGAIPLANFILGTLGGGTSDDDIRGLSRGRSRNPGSSSLQPIINRMRTHAASQHPSDQTANSLSALFDTLAMFLPENTASPATPTPRPATPPPPAATSDDGGIFNLFAEERSDEGGAGALDLGHEIFGSDEAGEKEDSEIDEIERFAVSEKISSMMDRVGDRDIIEFDKFVLNSQNKFQTVNSFKTITEARFAERQQPPPGAGGEQVHYLGNFMYEKYPKIKKWVKYIKIMANKTKFVQDSIYENFKLNTFSYITPFGKIEKLEAAMLFEKICTDASKVLCIKNIYTRTRLTNYETLRSQFSEILSVSNSDVLETNLVISFGLKPESVFHKELRFHIVYVKHGHYDNTCATTINADSDDVTSMVRIFDSTRPIFFTNWNLVSGRGISYDDSDAPALSVTSEDDECLVTDSQHDACVICKTLPRQIVLAPCGHLFACESCAEEFIKNTNSEDRTCPLCRQRCTDAIKIIG